MLWRLHSSFILSSFTIFFCLISILHYRLPSSTCPVLRPNSTIHALVRSVSYPRQCCGNEHCGEG
jgi:hypothetical protein